MDEDASDEFTVCQFAAFLPSHWATCSAGQPVSCPRGLLLMCLASWHIRWDLLQVKYLKLFWGQQPLTPLCWEGGGLFLTRLGHHSATGHIPHFKLKFSWALSIGTHGSGLIYFGVCFDQKFIFLVHFLCRSGENM